MKLNNKYLLSFLFLVLAISAGLAYYFSGSKDLFPKDHVVATYNQGVVTLKQAQIELNKLTIQNPDLKGIAFNDLTSDQKESIIKEVVLKELAYQQAKKQNLDQDQDYQESLKVFQSEMLKQKFFTKLASEARKEENLKKNYDKLVKDLSGKQDLKISYIALENENDANNVYNQLAKSPKSFAKIAKLRSVDKEAAKNGGNLDFVLEDALPKEIVDQVRKLEKGQISQPFSLADKWLIVKFEDSRSAKIISFEEAKENLAQSLAFKALQDFITQSLEEAKISIVVK